MIAQTDSVTPGPRPTRTFSLDSRYFLQDYSNEAMAGFGVDVLDLATLPGNLLDPEEVLGRAIESFMVMASGLLLGRGYLLAYHEFGHGTRAAAVGLKPHWGFGEIVGAEFLDEPPEDSYSGFFHYFAESLFHDSGYTLLLPTETLFEPFTDQEQAELRWDVLVAAAGLNNDVRFAEAIEDEVYRDVGHVGYLYAYIVSKMAARRYELEGVLGDLGNTVARYRLLGFDIDRAMIDKYSGLSLLFSATGYQLVHAAVRSMGGESFYFHGWEPHGIQLPNTSFYMTRAGISYKVRSGYRWGPWRFPVAVEHVLEGESRTELTLGAERHVDRLELRGEAIFGEGFGTSLNASWRMNDRFFVGGGYALYDADTFHGERSIPSLENGMTYHDLWLRVSVVY